MATAKAQTRGPSKGLQIWLIIAVALFLAAVVLLVLLYTDQADLKADCEELRTENEKLMSAGDKSDLRHYYDQAAGGRSFAAVMEEERGGAMLALTGEEGDDLAAAQDKIDEVIDQITDEGLVPEPGAFADLSMLDAFAQLYELFIEEHQLRQQALRDVERLSNEVETLANANAAEKDAFGEAAKGLQQHIATLETERNAYRRNRDAEFQAFSDRIDAMRNQSSSDLRDLRTTETKLNEQLENLQGRYGELQDKLSQFQIKPQSLSTARVADGVVMEVIPRDEIVYINLGREHRVTLGLQFAVYSAETGVPAGGESKARIEVISIRRRAAECRIVGTHGFEPIISGDLIANPVYDRQKSLRFAVFGNFDLDSDGRDDPAGKQRIAALIERWGGTVVEQITARTDFVVVGAEPPAPSAIEQGSAEGTQRYDEMIKQIDEYRAKFTQAQALSIPMLTQPVFLQFLGYASGDTTLPF